MSAQPSSAAVRKLRVKAKKVAGNSSAGNATKRLYILGAILCFWLIVVALRLVQLEIFQYGQFERRAMKQQQRTTDISPSRGVIYDRNGHELAMSITGKNGPLVASFSVMQLRQRIWHPSTRIAAVSA